MPQPGFKSVSDIKSALLQPALTSHFLVEINTSALGGEFTKFLNNNNVSYRQENLNLMCSEATLPGSNLATLEVTNDFHGVTERHAYRRVYDDRVDLTFYVDAENHMPIRFFETWLKFIADESIAAQPGKGTGSVNENYFYRFRYPNEYNKSTITITKFERTSNQKVDSSNINSVGSYSRRPLLYKFINAYPISISSMPVSYDSSSLLKCTVSMTYIRYILSPDQAVPSSDQFEAPAGNGAFAAATPEQQAAFNTTSNNLTGVGALATNVPGLVVGGIPLSAASSSGTTPGGIPSTGNAATGNINANIA